MIDRISKTGLWVAFGWCLVGPVSGLPSGPLAEQNAALLEQLRAVHGLTGEELTAVRAIFERSGYISQGNPAITRHPETPEQCSADLAAAGVSYDNRQFESICGDKYMAPLYDPASQTPEQATACIDQFEFPDIPCAYPVVWVRAAEAAQICEALGKRLCDAHEWEGACAGSLTEPDYRFDLASGLTPSETVAARRTEHNQRYSSSKSWSYGPEYQPGVCAAASQKSAGCDGGNWAQCGSNTYPAGSFPECRSSLGVYDLNGNAAEHMSLPLAESQMASRGSHEYGYTEMKGSWFIWDSYRAHEDWCRWRAPYWHGSRVMDPDSHHNYHLGFRCCKTLEAKP
jgi:hypothetical protein